VRNIKEIVIFDDEELTEEVVQARVRQTVTRTDTLVKPPEESADARGEAGDDHAEGEAA